VHRGSVHPRGGREEEGGEGSCLSSSVASCRGPEVELVHDQRLGELHLRLSAGHCDATVCGAGHVLSLLRDLQTEVRERKDRREGGLT
jgi:hypothetical protein